METLNRIYEKFNLLFVDEETPMPIELNFDRNQLASFFRELNFTEGAEIGVEQGVYSNMLLGKNPQLHLYSVDAWQSYHGYNDHKNQKKLDTFYDTTSRMLGTYGERSVIIREFSMNALALVGDESLDFVYIDANHDFASVTNDIFYWSKKVKKGGIISGHDYYKKDIPSHVHVPYVLMGYTRAYNITPWFIFDDSWMFVKE